MGGYGPNAGWNVSYGGAFQIAWSGFFGGKGTGTPRWYPRSDKLLPPTSVGARILGQSVDDHFGTAVGSDGTWLYISAPDHTALETDVPSLTTAVPAGDRATSGVVYQLRTDVRTGPEGTNQAQLWVEPGTQEDPNDPNSLLWLAWPYVDAEIPSKTDYTMPVPHQYIIESVGSWRGNYSYEAVPMVYEEQECVDAQEMEEMGILEVSPANQAWGYTPYQSATAGYNTDRTPQIVGPHVGAKISYVRGLGDVNRDGVRDFAVGSGDVEDPDTGTQVGAIYIVYGRAVGLEGDYLLENLHVAPSDPSRLKGFMLKGKPGEELARVFDNAGDFNGDGFADVIVGNELADGSTGEAVIILGSQFLESPGSGWTVDSLLLNADADAIQFVGEAAGDLVGANVAGAGDVDGDGFDDILIAAPGADGNTGAVYLIYGSDQLSGQIQLADVGTVDLPGAKLVGRAAGDFVGGGTKSIPAVGTVYSRGVARLGDINKDTRDDFAISAILADPQEREDAGEVYILYGAGD